MTLLYLIRHGETDWNTQGRTQGCGNDLPLNERGLKEAKALSLRFKNVPIDVLYSSDLKRAYQTASEISNVTGLCIHTTDRLREMNFGCFEGLTGEEIRLKYANIITAWTSKPRDAIIPDGETLVEVQKRMVSEVDEIINCHRGKNIIVVSHGMCLKVLLFSLLGFDISLYNEIRLDNTGVSIIEYKGGKPYLKLLNDTCHIRG